ncbi:HNH endonuclease signature motif containing protein [Nocardia gamkensis]|uniref:HNH endonuclease signature motif containing protein n=1 Tax=Nocardia gamkensis TaxID=352869 RepID=UPI0036ECDAA9
MVPRARPIPRSATAAGREDPQARQWTCQTCGEPGREVDHEDNVKAGGVDDDEHLWVLCTDCHEAKTQLEAAAGRVRASRSREPEPHPGRLPRGSEPSANL